MSCSKKIMLCIFLLLASAITASALENATLQVFDTGNTYANQTAYFYANYSYNTSLVTGADCEIEFSDTAKTMEENPLLYYTSRNFTQSGNYTYEITCRKENYTNETKQKIIQIFGYPDNDNDGYNMLLDCNDNNPNINPGKPEILFNGMDDDCSANTPDVLILSVATNKATYSPGEVVNINVNAQNGSDTYITVNTPTNVSYIYIFDNGTYPVVQQYTMTALSGNYSVDVVNYFGNYTLQDSADFSVVTTFNAEIQADRDSAYEGENIHFKALISGAQGNVNMIWNMGNNQQRYAQEFDYNYSAMGNYNVALIATDQGGNQIVKSKSITINRKYFLQVTAVDNSTGELLEDATIKLDSESKNANSTAQAIFDITNKTYHLKVSSDGYNSYSEDIKLNGSLLFTVRLIKDSSNTAPDIILISPADNSEVAELEFRYKFEDDSEAECKLYIAESEGWWEEINSTILLPNAEFSYKPDLENGTYIWKVTCEDGDNNFASSPESSVKVSSSVQLLNENIETTYDIVQNVYDLIPEFDKYSPDEQKIAEYLQLESQTKDTKRKLDMANRDLYNLRYEPTTDSLMKKRDEIYATIDGIKDATPQTVSVKDKAEFVKYVDDAEVEESLAEYAQIKNLGLSGNPLKSLIEQNMQLQKKATIQTVAYSVEITYISGRTEGITLVAREIEVDYPLDKLKFVEFVPKDIASSVSEIVFIDQPDSVLKDDPVFEYSLSKSSKFVYYLKNQASLESIPKIKPLLITTEQESRGSKVTGFSIFSTLGLSDSKRVVFILELVTIFVLLGIYLYYNYSPKNDKLEITSGSEYYGEPLEKADQVSQQLLEQKSEALVSSNTNMEKISYMKVVIQKAKDALSKNKLKDAALSYYEIKFMYDLLDSESKNALFREVIGIADELGCRHIEELVEKAIIELATGNREEAYSLYDEISEEFEKLSDEYKEKIYSRCCELAIHLKE